MNLCVYSDDCVAPCCRSGLPAAPSSGKVSCCGRSPAPGVPPAASYCSPRDPAAAPADTRPPLTPGYAGYAAWTPLEPTAHYIQPAVQGRYHQ